jgi:hypothetical protein
MTDKAFKIWHSMNDQALAAQVGAFIKHHRLDQNKFERI